MERLNDGTIHAFPPSTPDYTCITHPTSTREDDSQSVQKAWIFALLSKPSEGSSQDVALFVCFCHYRLVEARLFASVLKHLNSGLQMSMK
jgi:hypothetical protein